MATDCLKRQFPKAFPFRNEPPAKVNVANKRYTFFIFSSQGISFSNQILTLLTRGGATSLVRDDKSAVRQTLQAFDGGVVDMLDMETAVKLMTYGVLLGLHAPGLTTRVCARIRRGDKMGPRDLVGALNFLSRLQPPVGGLKASCDEPSQVMDLFPKMSQGPWELGHCGSLNYKYVQSRNRTVVS